MPQEAIVWIDAHNQTQGASCETQGALCVHVACHVGHSADRSMKAPAASLCVQPLLTMWLDEAVRPQQCAVLMQSSQHVCIHHNLRLGNMLSGTQLSAERPPMKRGDLAASARVITPQGCRRDAWLGT
jgi:hypothetical protein